MGLHDQEEDDQRAKDHEFDMGDGICPQFQTNPSRRIVQKNGQQEDKGRAQKRPQNGAQTTNNDHKQDLERPRDGKG